MPLMKLERRRSGGPVHLQVGEAAEELGEHDPDLQLGQAGAEAEVGADPEGEVGVGLRG